MHLPSRPLFRPVLAILAWLQCILLPTLCQAEEITSQRLIYRSADVVVERLREIFPLEEVQVSGLDNQLIIRARDRQTLAQVQALVQEIDRKPRQFRISLRRQGEQYQEQQDLGASGRVTRHSGNITITTQSSSRNSLGGSQQIVTVLEDNSVAIQQGQMRPVRDYYIGRNGVATSTRYQQLGDGLLVTPRMVGSDEVELSVRARHAAEPHTNSERIEQLELVTQRIVPLGSWSDLGSVSQQQNQRETGVIRYSTGQSRTLGSYEIKVELID